VKRCADNKEPEYQDRNTRHAALGPGGGLPHQFDSLGCHSEGFHSTLAADLSTSSATQLVSDRALSKLAGRDGTLPARMTLQDRHSGQFCAAGGGFQSETVPTCRWCSSRTKRGQGAIKKPGDASKVAGFQFAGRRGRIERADAPNARRDRRVPRPRQPSARREVQARCTDIIPATPCEQSAWRAVGPLTDSLPRAVSYPAVAVRAFAKPLGSWSRRKRAAARSPPLSRSGRDIAAPTASHPASNSLEKKRRLSS
jgi:hypothetical protein